MVIHYKLDDLLQEDDLETEKREYWDTMVV